MTLPVGRIDPDTQRLRDVTRDVLHLAVRRMGERRWWSEVAEEMQTFVRKAGFSVVEDFVGHGIGRTTMKIRRCQLCETRLSPGQK